MARHIMLIAGEVSGEQHAAAVAAQIKKNHTDWKLSGVGGNAMRSAGVKTVVDIRDLSVMGLTEVIAKLPTILSSLSKVKKHILSTKPDLIILVDFAGFNLKVAKFAKEQGIKVLYYISPKIWAWKASRIHKIKKYVDHMAVILPFEVDVYKKAGVPVTYVGSPIVESLKCDLTKDQAREALSLYQEKTTVGLLPGSRRSELKRLLPLMLDVAEKFPDLQFVLALAPTFTKEDLKPYKTQLRKNHIWIVKEQTHEVVRASDACIVASGTATLEVALLNTPMVVVYKMAPITFWLAALVVKVKNVSLCNIVANKRIVEELLQIFATQKRVSKELDRLLHDESYRQTMLNEYAKLQAQLKTEHSAAENVAKLVDTFI